MHPRSARIFYSWGNVLKKLGRDEEAIEKFSRAIEVNPSFHWALIAWGNTLRNLGRDEEAIEKYRRASEVSPAFSSAFVAWGNTLRILGRHEDAIEKFRTAAELDPKNSAVLTSWGNALQKLGRDEEAISIFDAALKLSPKRLSIHVSLAASYRKLNLQADYAREIQVANELIANQSSYNRACFESVRGNVTEAVELLKLALEKDKLRPEWAAQDPDMDFIRDDLRFKALVQSK